MNDDMIFAGLRLFKAYISEYSDESKNLEYKVNVNEEALKYGILISKDCPADVLKDAIDLYGVKQEEWNQTFHKSFQTVIDTPIEDLIAQQIIHYFTTYGLEAMGLYNEDYVYIPHEQLDIPDIDSDIKLTVIHGIIEEEFSARMLNLLTSGIALSKRSVEDIMILSDYINIEKFDSIKNNEIKIALYDKYNVVPYNNIEFLRYLIFKLTGSTMMIKSKELLESLSNCDKAKAFDLLDLYTSRPYGYKDLASIYLTQCEYFVAIKSHKPSTEIDKELNHIINRIRKESNKYKKSLDINILDRLTSIYRLDDTCGKFYYNTIAKVDNPICGLTQKVVTEKKILELLDDITIFREMRILNAIRYRVNVRATNILYKIRNGKAYVDDLPATMDADKHYAQKNLESLIRNHLISRLKVKLEGKSIYIPDNVVYMLPTSEKQFTGNFPSGTKLILPREKDLVIGVHWFNLDNQRVDLDLHALSRSSHFGWNGFHKCNDDVIFSGDITDAPKPDGATEVFRISSKADNTSFALKLKNYTHNQAIVPYEFIIATTDDTEIKSNYVINPNNVLTSIKLNFEYDKKLNTIPDIDLAVIDIIDNNIKVTFTNFSMDDSISGFNKDRLTKVLNYNSVCSETNLTLNEILEDVGCSLEEKPYKEILEAVKVLTDNGTEILYRKVQKRVDYDLSIESIAKDTIIDMLI